MYPTKVLIRFQHDLFTIHIPFTTMQIFDAGIPIPHAMTRHKQGKSKIKNESLRICTRQIFDR